MKKEKLPQMKCEVCSSDNLKFERCINWTPKTSISTHYRYWCMSCGHFKFIERTPENRKYVEDAPWILTAATEKRILKGELDITTLSKLLERRGLQVNLDRFAGQPSLF